MALELLFSAPALADIANNIIASLLVDSGKLGISVTTRRSLEEIYYKALKTCAEDLKPDIAKNLRDAFRTSKINQKVVAFQQSGEIIPASFFEIMFAPIVGKKSAPIYVKQFFSAFRQHLAKEKSLNHEIQLFYQEILFIHSQKHDQESQELLRQILERIKNPVSIEATIGYQQIPPLPSEFVMPQTAIDRIKSKLEKKNAVLIYGSPGSGKSVIATVFAEQAENSGSPVCWFRFKPGLTDKKVLMDTLLQFLHRETGSQENNLVNLLDHSRALFVFDDLHYVKDKELADSVYTVSSLFIENQNRGCRVLFTSREKSDFLPLHNIEWEHVLGLAHQEAENLVCEQYQLDITGKQLRQALEIFENHPQFINFFKQWYDAANPDHGQVDQYLSHADQQDDRLQDYLMRELYHALGKSHSNENKLLFAVAFFRIPETRAFIESLYEELGGDTFSDTLTLMQKRKGLVKYLDDVERFDIHDVLREFYYQRLDQKIKWHSHCAQLYKERSQSDQDVIDNIEAAHHYRKSNNHGAAVGILQPITHECMVHGFYWQQLINVLERLNLKNILDEELLFWTLYNRGNLYINLGNMDSALHDFDECIKIKSQQENHKFILNSLGLIYANKYNWHNAIKYYHKGETEFKKLNDSYNLAIIYMNKGNLYLQKGEFKYAMENYFYSLKYFRGLRDKQGMAKIYTNIGIVYQQQEAWEKSVEYYRYAIKELEQTNNFHVLAKVFFNIGNVYYLRGDVENAIKYYQNSIEIRETTGDIHGVALVHGSLGNIYRCVGDYDNSLKLFQKAIKLLEHIGDVHSLGLCYGNLSQLYFEQKKYDDAFMLILETILVFTKTEFIFDLKQCINIMYLFKEDIDESIFLKTVDKLLKEIFEKGVTWGRHKILSPAEAKEIWGRLNL